ncbi:MAG: ABC transporter substrate-binding protein [Clostridia bacterium]|nr:ABC transporter substrate-binding protein [Clostridia bacterium]NCC43888.1 ABC transporter substrate-binding protein [Clostridia bacterium]
MKKRMLSILLAAGLVSSMLAGCGGSTFDSDAAASTDSTDAAAEGTDAEASTEAPAVEAGDSDTLNVGLYSDIISLDSAFAYDFTTNPVVSQITESLLYYDENDELQPYLCESWEEVDPTTYVYNVRDDVTFSDGTPMTMDDVMFSVQRYQDPDLASYLLWMYDSVESVEQTGDWQFTVKLTQPDALWKHTFATTAGMVHSKTYAEAHPDDYGTAAGGVLGTGPYVYEKWDVGNQITMSYNENWWNKDAGEPQIKNINFLIIPEDTTRVMASTSGQIDINLSQPVDMLSDLEKAEGVDLLTIPSMGLEFLSFNCAKAPFDDVNVRKAIAYALDNDSMAENVIKEFGTNTNAMPVPESLFLFEEDTWMEYEKTCENYAYDIDKAKECLAASEYPDGFTCTITVDQKSITNSIALIVQQQLAQIGIEATIEKVSNDEVVSLQFGSGIDENGVRPYDIGIFEWSSDFPDPSGVLTPLYMSTNAGDGGSNSCAYSNEEVDKLLADQAASTDNVERTDLMLQALDIINDEVPNYIWTHQNWMFGVNDRVTGGISQLTGSWFWNFYVKNITVE